MPETNSGDSETALSASVRNEKLSLLAISKIWEDLHYAWKAGDIDTVEAIELKALMLYQATHQVLRSIRSKRANP